MLRRGLLLGALALAACGRRAPAPKMPQGRTTTGLYPGETFEMRRKIDFWAAEYDLPVSLVHRLVQRESDYNPRARNGPYWGLLQILPQTARTMGHRGPPSELLDPDVNLRYGLKYLRGAWLVADGDPDRAIMWYAKGYYYEAKRKGLLEATGLRS